MIIIQIDECVCNKKTIKLDDSQRNHLESLFFDLKKGLLKIPIPFISTPVAMFVITDEFDVDSERIQVIEEVLVSTRRSIQTYVFSNLLLEVRKLIEDKEIHNFMDLTKSYVELLSKYILPVRHSINSTEENLFPWVVDKDEHCCDLTFNVNGYEINERCLLRFKLTSFTLPNDSFDTDNQGTRWYHENEKFVNQEGLDQIKNLFGHFYSMIYDLWNEQNRAIKTALQSAVSQIFARNYAHNIGSHVKVNAGLVNQVERVNELFKNDRDTGYDPLRIKSISLADDLLKYNLSSKTDEILSAIEKRIINENSSSLNKLPNDITAEQREYLDDLIIKIEKTFDRFKRTYGGKQNVLEKIRNHITDFKEEKSNVLGIDIENILGILVFHKKLLDEYEIQRNEFISNPKMPTLNKKLFKEVLAPFTENTLLMDNLCKSEGVRYEIDKGAIVNKLKVYFLFTSGETGAKAAVKIVYPQLKRLIKRTDINEDSSDENKESSVEYPDAFPYLIDSVRKTKNKGLGEYIEVLKASYSEKKLYINQKEGDKKRWEKLNDVEVALPGPHPLYSILENFIRNSSKHNAKKIEKEKDGELQIFLDIREEESSYRVLLYDNVSDLNDDKLLRMYDSLETSLLDEENDYTPKNSNLGMFDKRINAHLLSSADEITNDNLRNSITLYRFKRENGICGDEEKVDDALIQEIENSDEESENIHPIALSFHIAKAKKVCWIGFKSDIIDNVREDLKTEGIYFFEDISSYEEFNKREKISVAAWEFAVMSYDTLNNDAFFQDAEDFNEDIVANNFEKFATDLPFRILIDTESVNKKDLSSKANKVLNLLIRRRRIQPTYKRLDFDTILTSQKERDSEGCRAANNMLEWCWQNWLMRWTKDELSGVESCNVTLAVFPDTGIGGTGGKKENVWKSIQEELEKDHGKDANLFEMENISFHLEADSSVIKDLNDDQKVIMYDQHGIWSKSQSERPKKSRDSDMGKIIRNGFYEVFSKNSEDFVHIFYPPEDPFERKIFCYQLLEAGLCKVSVMDERLNSYMLKNTFANSENHILNKTGMNNLRNCDYADTANLFQLDGTNHENILKKGKTNTKENRLESKNASERGIYVNEGNQGIECVEQNIENKLSESFNKKYNPSDVLIIHRTFLKDEMWSKNNISCEQILNSLRKYYPFVIVISGGGKPNLEEDFKYKPYNLYKDLFGDQVNKWSIVRYSMV